MAYAQSFLRFVMIGGVYATDDFSFGFTLRHTVPAAVVPAEVPAGLISAAAEFFQVTGMITKYSHLRTLKLNHIGVDGRYIGDDTVQYDYPTPIAGASLGTPPPQLALAVSLRTAVKRGRAHAGRFYVPTVAFPVGTNGRLAGTDCLQVASAAFALLDAAKLACPGWEPAVVSNLGAGAEHTITHVEVGDVADTIRSRRNKFVETYSKWPAGV